MTFHPDSLPDLTGKVYIVTGGTSGIGFYTVARLAQHGAHVYLCARSEAKGRKAVEEIQALYPTARVSTLVMDHEVLASVAAAADLFLSKESRLHGLVNNAGVMAVPRRLTADGYEVQWQTNYVAHWLFTERLLPLMLATSRALPAGAVRVANLTSGGNMMAPRPGVDLADTSLREGSAIARYGQSKLANILHAQALHRRVGPRPGRDRATEGEVWTSSIHPGVVKTGLDAKATEAPFFIGIITFVLNVFGAHWPADRGAWTSVFCVASPDMRAEQSGTFFERIARAGTAISSKAKDEKLEARLEEWTREEMEKKGWV
ncbi:uncharacterized protein E0L32_011508 [Thyridium curvatum]|uniref:NAD(P)-binding protein n=1 Tax=Thyridium curvatum TaxID=1093900 RepID=A0A507BMU5_9PEZI|nr:uncharacterized protein E0L32_011508 [Thyridium curvatum]TPX18829.1 hypothetical protein E0L32_011508 [Thyridium curvatum]